VVRKLVVGSGALGLVGSTTGAVPVAAGVVDPVSGAAGGVRRTDWSGVGVGGAVVVWIAAAAAGTAVVGWVGAHVPVAPLIDTVAAVVRPGPATAVPPIANPALPSSAATIMAITVVRRRMCRPAIPFTAGFCRLLPFRDRALWTPNCSLTLI
jgi:hypothetical protein